MASLQNDDHEGYFATKTGQTTDFDHFCVGLVGKSD